MIFASGWDRFYLEGDAGSRYALDVVSGREPGWPAPTLEMIKALAARGVTTVGTDAPSIGLAHDGRPVHVFGHGLEMIFLESLANLAQMPQSGAYFIFLPVKVAGSSGGPGRAVGIVPFGAMQGSRT